MSLKSDKLKINGLIEVVDEEGYSPFEEHESKKSSAQCEDVWNFSEDDCDELLVKPDEKAGIGSQYLTEGKFNKNYPRGLFSKNSKLATQNQGEPEGMMILVSSPQVNTVERGV